MSGGFCGIDPPALDELTLRLDWAAADIDIQAIMAHERLARHSRWAAADGIATRLAVTANWSRLSAVDLRGRAGAMISAQGIGLFGPPLISGPWRQEPSLLTRPGPIVPGFPFGNPLDYLRESEIPWDEIEDWVRGALGVWNGRRDDTFPIGRWVFGTLWMNRVSQYVRGTGPLINGVLHVPSVLNGFVPRNLANVGYFRWINNPAVQVVGRRVSIGLGVVSTVGDAIVVYEHGNPIDAFGRDGAGYVADVARLGFSASTTAFLIAPNPVTGGVVVVTGVVWAGAEVVDHWDDITESWGDVYGDFEDGSQWIYTETSEAIGEGWDWTTDRWTDTTVWTADRFDDATTLAGDVAAEIENWSWGALDNLSRGWDWTTDRLNDAAEVAGVVTDGIQDAGEGLVDGISTAADYAGNKLDDATDWTGHRIDDVGGVVVGGLGTLFGG